jgi:hypothetical protein
MKNPGKFLFFSFLMALTACSSVYQLSIDVQEPAPLTLPVRANRVLVVNNTVGQPNNVGLSRTFGDQPVENYKLDLDSVSWVVMEGFVKRIEDAYFFEEVSFYKNLIRGDDEWIATIPLPEAFRNELFDVHGFDAIISIDRFLFNMDVRVKPNVREQVGSYSYFFTNNRIEGGVTCSVYLYNKKTPFSTFTLTDSLFYKESLYTDSLMILKELPESMVIDLAHILGEKSAYHITPSWFRQERILYVGSNSRMQEALSYSKKGNWNKAEFLWLDLFDRKTKNSDKAKLANNIALAYEMRDNLEIALRWAEKAKEYFSEGTKEYLLAGKYVSDLQQRIQNNRILDVQWGEE